MPEFYVVVSKNMSPLEAIGPLATQEMARAVIRFLTPAKLEYHLSIASKQPPVARIVTKERFLHELDMIYASSRNPEVPSEA